MVAAIFLLHEDLDLYSNAGGYKILQSDLAIIVLPINEGIFECIQIDIVEVSDLELDGN